MADAYDRVKEIKDALRLVRDVRGVSADSFNTELYEQEKRIIKALAEAVEQLADDIENPQPLEPPKLPEPPKGVVPDVKP